MPYIDLKKQKYIKNLQEEMKWQRNRILPVKR